MAIHEPTHSDNAGRQGPTSRRPPTATTDTVTHTLQFRVRYSETDQMATFYNSRALEWFEVGRTELMRALGLTYAEMESCGIFLPLVEAHLNFQGRAKYDDLLEMTSRMKMEGKASVRFDVSISHAPQALDAPRSGPVVSGYTVHGIVDAAGKLIRCPDWVRAKLESANKSPQVP